MNSFQLYNKLKKLQCSARLENQIKSVNSIQTSKPNIQVKRSLSNVCVILNEHHFQCNLYIMVILANTHESLGTVLN